jgi:phosphoribosylanthranilate isomerase
MAVFVGASYVGFVHYAPSPRHVTLDMLRMLSNYADSVEIPSVAVVVAPDNPLLEALQHIDSLSYIQLHGGESLERIKQIQRITDKKLIKACSISTMEDMDTALLFEPYCDHLLFDAKTSNPNLPGGMGQSFDWTFLQSITTQNAWFLAGGLDINNVEMALEITHAPLLDISSGIESESGVKDHLKMRAFMDKLQNNIS